MYNIFETDSLGNIISKGYLNYQQIEFNPSSKVNYYNTIGAAVTILGISTGQTNLVPIEAGTFTNYFGFTNSGTDGEITYSNSIDRAIFISASVSCKSATANLKLSLSISVNNVTISTILFSLGVANTNVSASISDVITMSDEDYLTIKIGNMTEVSNITVTSLNITAHG